jgi:hypothetical protein
MTTKNPKEGHRNIQLRAMLTQSNIQIRVPKRATQEERCALERIDPRSEER